MADILGLHHVTAIAGEPQQNLDFYAGLMGLRVIKVTVNYDDPQTYHLYFGDGPARPGTILTFFPWPGAPKGRKGAGQATAIAFSVPGNSIPYWVARLGEHGVRFEGPAKRFGDEVISFSDPDGLDLELVGCDGDDRDGAWEGGPVPKEHGVRGLFGVTLSEEGYEGTASLLTESLGFRRTKESGSRFRYEVAGGGAGATVDILCQPEARAGLVSVGTIHHVAWRTPTDAQQREWRQELVRASLNVTPVIDRTYFHSIYFREPGGVLFEIATDPPGFTVDEKLSELGTKLMLPPRLEPFRTELTEVLPHIKLPHSVQRPS
jgi:glyoxalase family protein